MVYVVRQPESPLSDFISQLMIEGVARVCADPALPFNEEQCGAALAEWERIARSELAGEAPPFSIAAGVWAAKVFYQACRFLVCRDLSEEEVVRGLQARCPEPRGPVVDWSVDLLFRQLPEIHRQARHVSNGDPLVRELLALAADWPLSTVGIKLEKSPCLKSFVEHPALRQLYIDRILALEDFSRLGDSAIDEGLRVALGIHAELCPAIAGRLTAAADPGALSAASP
jgi:hypothetical protein